MSDKITGLHIDKTKLEESVYTYMVQLKKLMSERLVLSEKVNEAYFNETPFNVLYEDNQNMYKELNLGYANSYANPDVAKAYLPSDIAGICTWLYYEVSMLPAAIFQEDHTRIQRIQFYILRLYDALVNGDDVQAVMSLAVKEHLQEVLEEDLERNYHNENFATQLIAYADLNDARYLFRYGIYISENELAYFEQMKTSSKELIQKLAAQMVNGYHSSFTNRNKTITKRDCSRIVNIVGLEKITQEIINELSKLGQCGMVGDLVYKNYHAQVIHDHRQDSSLFIDEDFMKQKLTCYEAALSAYKDDLLQYRGNIIMVSFGQEKQDLLQKNTSNTYSHTQNNALKEYELNAKILFENYVPKKEISFTGMAYPAKEIHEDYARIFAHIMEINLMDSKRHEDIQELLINELDKGEFVEIIGYRGNETHMQVALPKLQDESKQTNFVNCGADINHPVGEVFTSPQLANTKGILHIKQARISKIAFHNIKVTFEDGFVKDYSCTNSDDEKANHDLMEEVILHHRDTLPMGEFALGTNTYAYALAKKDGILYKLHTLIYEKLGPHMAIGDTCFAWSEDNVLTSMQSGKEIIAKDNSVSILRHEDLKKAYTGVHYDLTIPYDEIYSITVHQKGGSTVELVHEGRFVLDGCEYLNEPLDRME